MVGLLYLSGAALWRDKGQLTLGIFMVLLGSNAAFFGNPTNNLIMAIAGGGAFLVAAGIGAVRVRRI
jgi:hypothetical protein